MGKVILTATMSVDGFIADPSDAVGRPPAITCSW
jgi:hypothetical protein